MKFSVGYQLQDENGNPFARSLCEISEHIHEVYFPWVFTDTCRASINDIKGTINWNSQAFLEEDLFMLKKNGIRLNLLMNANCYGDKAVSKYLKNRTYSIIDHLESIGCGLDAVTTTSPFIAAMVKKKYPMIRTIASVNMRIGTIKGIDYLKDAFDGFYIQGEHNRDIEYIRGIKKYTDKIGKSLHMLANSGCMTHCSMQTFHDNAVAHETNLLETDNEPEFETAGCWNYYKRKENQVGLLQNTWIRPEDIHNYDDIFNQVKLATRTMQRPINTIKAYIFGKFYGNTLSLMEPNHTKSLGGFHVDNTRFPADFFRITSTCSRRCNECDYCSKVLKEVLVETKTQ